MKFLIVGTGRCGSTFLREVLNQHPDIYVVSESYWHIPLLEKYGDLPTPSADILKDLTKIRFQNGESILGVNLAEIGVTLEDFMAHLTNCFGNQLITAMDLFATIEVGLLHFAKKRIYADKTPHYGYHLEKLRSLWPELKVVHILRDGRECAVSMSCHEGFQLLANIGIDDWTRIAPFGGDVHSSKAPITDFSPYLDMWARQVEQTSAAVQHLPEADFLELRYEDMLGDPEGFFLRLANFLGITDSPDWVASCASQIAIPHQTQEMKTKVTISPFAGATLEKFGYKI